MVHFPEHGNHAPLFFQPGSVCELKQRGLSTPMIGVTQVRIAAR